MEIINFSEDILEKKIQEMVSLQKTLNDATNGEGWETGVNQNGKEINWNRCIYMEAFELIDSYPWKHWKDINLSIDSKNIEIELVDIWHFILSKILQFNDEKESVILLKKVILELNFNPNNTKTINESIKPFEELVLITLKDEISLVSLVKSFFRCCHSVSFSFNYLFKLYIAKNYLNKFRQDHGYKNGEYKKIWNGVEDNSVMHDLIEQSEDFDGHSFYELLEQEYLKVNG